MLKRFLLAVLALFVLFEEWLWDILTLLGQRLSRLLHLERFDTWLSQASPRLALLALGIPLAAVTPINIGAVILMMRGQIAAGVFLEIVAKLLGTLLVARVFRLTRPALMSFVWFAAIYGKVIGILAWAHGLVTDTPFYRKALTLKAEMSRRIRSVLKI